MEEPGKSDYFYRKETDMGTGAIAVATLFLCLGLLIVVEIKERFL